MKVSRDCVRGGIVAGLAGGALIVALFFGIDLARGAPLATPRFLAGALLGTAGAAGIAAYTLLHFVAFAILGTVAAVLLDVTGVPRNLLVGAVYGLFACSLAFYPALVLAGTDILAAPDWPLVFGANLAAGVAIVAVLRRVGPEDGVLGVWGPVWASRVLREGVIVGLLGAGTVAVWFLVVDAIAGQPLFTPGALGSAVFGIADAAGGVEVSAATVIGYSAVHVTGFLLIGVALAAILLQVEKFPPLAAGLLILLVVFGTFFIFITAMLGSWLLDALAWWSVLAGNLLAAVLMGVFLARRHPGIAESLRDDGVWTDG